MNKIVFMFENIINIFLIRFMIIVKKFLWIIGENEIVDLNLGMKFMVMFIFE